MVSWFCITLCADNIQVIDCIITVEVRYTCVREWNFKKLNVIMLIAPQLLYKHTPITIMIKCHVQLAVPSLEKNISKIDKQSLSM